MADEGLKLTFTFPSGREYAIDRPKDAIKKPALYPLEGGARKPLPSTARMAWNYAKAVAKWKKAGSPLRSQERIDEILTTCKSCPMFAELKGRTQCRLCGCSLNAAPDGLNNKIAMATESCPLSPPKWTAEPPATALTPPA